MHGITTTPKSEHVFGGGRLPSAIQKAIGFDRVGPRPP